MIKTKPASVIEDIERVMEMAGFRELPKNKVTIIKTNISWHFPFSGANTTPWQLEGVIKALKKLAIMT